MEEMGWVRDYGQDDRRLLGVYIDWSKAAPIKVMCRKCGRATEIQYNVIDDFCPTCMLAIGLSRPATNNLD